MKHCKAKLLLLLLLSRTGCDTGVMCIKVLKLLFVSSREERPKVNVQIFDNGTKVSFFNPRTFYFIPERSVGDPEVDLIRTVNVPAVVSLAIMGC